MILGIELETIQSVVHLRIGTCYRSLFPNLQKPRKVIASVKDQANIIILEEYRKILGPIGHPTHRKFQL